MVSDARQIGVPQIGKNHCFEAELSRILIGGEQVLFDSHIHTEVFIHGAINGSHPTLAKNFNNTISLM